MGPEENSGMANLKVCVYCASSQQCDAAYLDAAERLGRHLASHQATLVYGGGGAGAMGRLADGTLRAGGTAIGIIPRFMMELEWGHPRLTAMRVVADIRERKHLMLDGADAVVALAGGCGTLEELFETITLKRLGQYLRPIILVNTRGFYDRVTAALEHCINERFMDPRHRAMWTMVNDPEDVLEAIRTAPPWSAENRSFAVQQAVL
jgi:uncharacterized protein (TIGR00730 family)